MKKSKKIFLLIGFLFFVAMAFIGYDIAKRTTFPGAKNIHDEKVKPADSIHLDTLDQGAISQ